MPTEPCSYPYVLVYLRNSEDCMPNRFLQFTHGGVSNTEMKPKTAEEIIGQGIREGWIIPAKEPGRPWIRPENHHLLPVAPDGTIERLREEERY